jgi:hypothetical protein
VEERERNVTAASKLKNAGWPKRERGEGNGYVGRISYHNISDS